MQSKIDEIMGLVDYVEFLAKNTGQTSHLKEYIRSQLRELVREPLSDEQIEELIHSKHFKKDCLQLRMESTNVNLNWYRLGLRDGEAAHNITK